MADMCEKHDTGLMKVYCPYCEIDQLKERVWCLESAAKHIIIGNRTQNVREIERGLLGFQILEIETKEGT